MTRRIEAKAILSAEDKTGGVFDRVVQKIRRMSAAADSANKRVAGAASRVSAAGPAGAGARASSIMGSAAGGALLSGAGRFVAPAAIAYGGVKAYQRFASAEEAITRIGITADATDGQIKAMEGSLRSLAAGTGKSFKEVSEGVNALVTGGTELKDALTAIPAITKAAQASGSEIQDVANTSMALTQNLGIQAKETERAFDILVAGGKAGKFELKDMARYLPTIAPAAAALGMKGEEGLMRIVTALQVVRNGVGTTEEAASAMQNVFQKMESEETSKKFGKMGIDLRKEMAKARAEGKDLLEVFVDLSDKALKGDLSKVPQLFTDTQFSNGMRALLTYRDLAKKVRADLDNAAGSVNKDLGRVMKISQMELNKMSEAWDRATVAVGAFIGKIGATKALDVLAKTLDRVVENADPDQHVKSTYEPNLNLVNPNLPYEPESLKAKGNMERFDAEMAQRHRDEPPLPPVHSAKELADWQREFRPDINQPLTEKVRKAAAKRFGANVPEPRRDPRRNIDPSLGHDVPAPPIAPVVPNAVRNAQPAADNKWWLKSEERAHIERIMRQSIANREMPPAQPPSMRAVPALPGLTPEQAQVIAGGIPASGAPVTATLTGSAEVHGESTVRVEVTASSLLLQLVEQMKQVPMMLRGQLNANGPGSVGKSSPDAAAPAQVGPAP